jgi:hypothetical protein
MNETEYVPDTEDVAVPPAQGAEKAEADEIAFAQPGSPAWKAAAEANDRPLREMYASLRDASRTGVTPGQAFRDTLIAGMARRGLPIDPRHYRELPEADRADLEAAGRAVLKLGVCPHGDLAAERDVLDRACRIAAHEAEIVSAGYASAETIRQGWLKEARHQEAAIRAEAGQ